MYFWYNLVKHLSRRSMSFVASSLSYRWAIQLKLKLPISHIDKVVPNLIMSFMTETVLM